MKYKLTRKEADEKIDKFFRQDKLDVKEVKKIKKLAMKYHIRLKEHKRRFCKKCFSDLKGGRVRIKRGCKILICRVCDYENKWVIDRFKSP
ncbi:MAG: hypothetical protein Q8P57_00820 [Candidatus Pacearchaeota archaeon]|nr:hypothetical protein [Candidatus Pacearchaeota archaeon]